MYVFWSPGLSSSLIGVRFFQRKTDVGDAEGKGREGIQQTLCMCDQDTELWYPTLLFAQSSGLCVLA